MSEPDDKGDLSRLARSIDALFAKPAAAGLVSGEDLPEEQDGGDVEATAIGVDSPEPSRPHEEEEAGTVEVAMPPWLESDAFPGEITEPEASWEEPASHEVLTVSVEPADRSDEPAPLEGDADPDSFVRAVDEFIAGSPDAVADVEQLAEGLRERLVLDPLADAVERLVWEAGDPPDPVFLELARAVINPAVASRLVQRIGHVRDDARKAEYTVLCQRLGEIMAKGFRGALTGATESSARRTYFDILIAMRDTSAPIIEGMVDDENALLVRSAITMLGEIGGARARELVTSGLAHPDARIRREALLALGRLGDEESRGLVVGLLEDSEPEVRVAAATAAGELKADRALRPILALLDAEDGSEGAVPFIDALGRLGDPGAVPAIEKHAVKTLFSKPPAEVRVAAYRALHLIGTPHARDLVQQALSDKEPGVRAAMRAIVGAAATRQPQSD